MQGRQLALGLGSSSLADGEEGDSTSSTFVANMGLPVHGWFRYSAGFSSAWARTLIATECARRGDLVVLDPFAGVGTAIIASEEAGARAYGLETHPFVARIARAKLLWSAPFAEFHTFAYDVRERARAREGTTWAYPDLIRRCFPEAILRDLDALKSAWAERREEAAPSELTWLALVAILRSCSPVGTAPWQYVLPRKAKASVRLPFAAFTAQVDRMAADMAYRQATGVTPRGRMVESDARSCAGVADCSIDLVVTSPPYPNNYDYADATRLEMSFFGEVGGWGDLHQKVRRHLIMSCSQHAAAEKVGLDDLLTRLEGAPIANDLRQVCSDLSVERLNHGGKKDYHLMVGGYFADMNEVMHALRRVCKGGATICFIVGDSAPYGIHVPVDRWLGELAVAAGFRSYRFEKLRDRNVKWANRKHRVPLHEGRLWIEG